MLAKLLALISQLKAAGVTVVILAGATTATVAATSPEVQDAVNNLASNVGLSRSCDDGQGQPAVVAQRNAADKLLRAAYQKDVKALDDLRGGKDHDNQKVGAIVRDYSDQLRSVLNTALNQSAALTLGRVGQVRKDASASPSGSPAPTTAPSPSTSPSGKPTCAPATTTTANATPSASPSTSASGNASPTDASPSASASAKVEGRVTVAERTTLDAALQTIVDQAIKDMHDLVTKATDEVANVPAPEHGKPSDNPGSKPSDKGKPSENPGNKPSDKGKPTATP